MGNITYKQAKSHNRKLKNRFYKDELTWEEYREAEISIADLVKDHLKTDANLPAQLKAYFHVRNPNGLGAQMSDHMKYSYYGNAYAKYHYDSLLRLCTRISPSASKVWFHISELRSELKKIKEEVA